MAQATPRSARLPVVAVMLVLLGVTAALLRRCLQVCEGHLVYALDDPYIHMTMARNLATHGSWGIAPGAFDPASSSPLWTLMLAALVRTFGSHEAMPLILNVLCMLGVVVVLDRALREVIPRPIVRGGVLLVILLAIGLPGLALTGMEPILHVLIALLLAWAAAQRLGGPVPTSRRGEVRIAMLAALAVLARFESLFLIGSLGVAALARRRFATAAALAAGAGTALAGYAAFALPQGGLWLPNSVLLHDSLGHRHAYEGWEQFVRRIPDHFQHDRTEHLPALLVASAWFLLPRRGITSPHASAARVLLAVTGVTLLIHMQLADLDAFFRRYEAYLVALGVFGVVVALASGLGGLPDGPFSRLPRVPAPAIAALAAVTFFTPFLIRGQQLLRWTPRASQNIYEQQLQMARFVRERFRDRVVAINDLGAVSYYGGARVIDLCGLASMPIARAILAKRYDTAFIERFCAAQGVEVALVYESWFVGTSSLPRMWVPVARWTLRDNLAAGDETVTLFATNPATADRVRKAEREFSATLPPRVAVETLP